MVALLPFKNPQLLQTLQIWVHLRVRKGPLPRVLKELKIERPKVKGFSILRGELASDGYE